MKLNEAFLLSHSDPAERSLFLFLFIRKSEQLNGAQFGDQAEGDVIEERKERKKNEKKKKRNEEETTAAPRRAPGKLTLFREESLKLPRNALIGLASFLIRFQLCLTDIFARNFSYSSFRKRERTYYHFEASLLFLFPPFIPHRRTLTTGEPLSSFLFASLQFDARNSSGFPSFFFSFFLPLFSFFFHPQLPTISCQCRCHPGAIQFLVNHGYSLGSLKFAGDFNLFVIKLIQSGDRFPTGAIIRVPQPSGKFLRPPQPRFHPLLPTPRLHPSSRAAFSESSTAFVSF